MTKLLIVTTSYPDENEGHAAAGIFVRNFAEECVRQGLEVEVVSPASRNNVQIEKGVRVRRFSVPKLPLSLLNPKAPGDWPAILQALSQGSRTVLAACAEQAPDHILALWALPSGAWARTAARRFRINYSTWALGSDIWLLGRIPVVRSILQGVLADAQSCFADGYQLAADVQALSGRSCAFLPSSRILQLAEPKILRQAPPYRLSFIGRWHSNKGIDLLLDALELLDEESWKLIESVRIHGGGPLETEVHTQARRIAEAGKPLVIGGYLDQNSATQLLQKTDYLLLPSRIESIPVVFSDALQTHCPIVANPVGDLPLLFGRYQVGELASQPTAADFAVALKKALEQRPSDFEKNINDALAIFDTAHAVARLRENISKRI